jgi:hypothetical protein
MYAEYQLYCIDKKIDYVGEVKFHEIRKHERVGILKGKRTFSLFHVHFLGDQFFNPERIKLKKYKNELAKLEKKNSAKSNSKTKKEIKELQSKIRELESVFDFYKERKQLYREDHLELEEDDDTAVMTLDFFKAECGNAGEHDYHDLICVFASQKELVIPQSLLGKQRFENDTLLLTY